MTPLSISTDQKDESVWLSVARMALYNSSRFLHAFIDAAAGRYKDAIATFQFCAEQVCIYEICIYRSTVFIAIIHLQGHQTQASHNNAGTLFYIEEKYDSASEE